MRTEVLPNAAAVAQRAATLLAESARAALAARGRFLCAVSGGHTPALMLQALAKEDLPWETIHLFQVDERVAPDGDPNRNLTQLEHDLLQHVPLPAANLHAMPVEQTDLDDAAASYARELEMFAGSPAVLDLIHLGLGADGHTASLVPQDPVLEIADCDVATTSVYAGFRRMTLTFPALNRAQAILWVVTGAEKTQVLPRLAARDRSIPAGRVRVANSVLLADAEAASSLDSND